MAQLISANPSLFVGICFPRPGLRSEPSTPVRGRDVAKTLEHPRAAVARLWQLDLDSAELHVAGGLRDHRPLGRRKFHWRPRAGATSVRFRLRARPLPPAPGARQNRLPED